ncbi:MAG: hypothetical protein NC328_06285 [Muribaculum sp.]|nr:hypothetical protein [Muribaculum sp.]
MKLFKLFTNNTTLALAAMVVFSTASAVAATKVDLGEIDLGKIYSVPDSEEATGHLTIPVDGTLLVHGADYTIYTNEAMTTQLGLTYKGYASYGDFNGQLYSNKVTAGQELWVKIAPWWGTANVMLEIEGYTPAAMKLDMADPGVGTDGNLTTFNLSMYSTLTLRFNMPIKPTPTAFVRYTNNGGVSSTTALTCKIDDKNDRVLEVTNIGEVLEGLLADNSDNGITAGSEFEVIFANLVSTGGTAVEGTDSNGAYILKYKVSSPAVTIEKITAPEYFLSYWAADNKEGIITIEATGAISTTKKPTCIISFGNSEGVVGEDYYREVITPTVEGNSVYVNLTDKLRQLSNYKAGAGSEGRTSDMVSIAIKDLYDLEGKVINTGDDKSPGSISLNIPYKEIPKAEVKVSFTPEAGNKLTSTTMEATIIGLNTIDFTGFNVTYTPATRADEVTSFIAKADCTESNVSSDGNEATYTFTIPTEALAADNVVVGLAGVTSNDGYDYADDVKATFNDVSSAVEAIGIENGNAPVFNIQGIQVGTGVQDLPAGLYIVNGKKIIVK